MTPYHNQQTESWWQQALGEAIVGEYTGTRVNFLASQVMSFGGFAAEFPAGEVLAIPDAVRAYPFTTLTKHGVVNDDLAATPVVIFFKRGVSSALDTGLIDQGRHAGGTVVFDRRLDDQVLTFAALLMRLRLSAPGFPAP